MSENFNEEVDGKPLKRQVTRKSFIISCVTAVALGFGAAAGYVFVLEPQVKTMQAQKQLNDMFENKAPIAPANTNVYDFKVYTEAKENRDVEQKALGTDHPDTSGVFSFDNKKHSSKTNALDVYIDFNSQRSRDFININTLALRHLVENSTVILNIHPVPTNDAFSAYGPEALALTFEKFPEKSWEVFTQLMKLSVVLDDEGVTDSKKVLERIVEALESQGVQLTSDDISRGEYSSWILSAADSQDLISGGSVPIIYLNNQLVDQDKIDINNSESLINYINKEG